MKSSKRMYSEWFLKSVKNKFQEYKELVLKLIATFSPCNPRMQGALSNALYSDSLINSYGKFYFQA